MAKPKNLAVGWTRPADAGPTRGELRIAAFNSKLPVGSQATPKPPPKPPRLDPLTGMPLPRRRPGRPPKAGHPSDPAGPTRDHTLVAGRLENLVARHPPTDPGSASTEPPADQFPTVPPPDTSALDEAEWEAQLALSGPALDEQREKAHRLYLQGATSWQIAQQLKVPAQSVAKWARDGQWRTAAVARQELRKRQLAPEWVDRSVRFWSDAFAVCEWHIGQMAQHPERADSASFKEWTAAADTIDRAARRGLGLDTQSDGQVQLSLTMGLVDANRRLVDLEPDAVRPTEPAGLVDMPSV